MLEHAHRFFSSNLFNLTQNRGFKGQLLQIPPSATKNDFLPARRFLKMDNSNQVIPGDVIKTVSGIKYLCQERGAAEYRDRIIYKMLRLYQVTDTMEITVSTAQTDSILGKPVVSGQPTSLGTFDLAIEPTQLESDGMRSLTKVVRIISPVEVPNGAAVGGQYRITDSNAEGGLFFLTASKL